MKIQLIALIRTFYAFPQHFLSTRVQLTCQIILTIACIAFNHAQNASRILHADTHGNFIEETQVLYLFSLLLLISMFIHVCIINELIIRLL